eukprot:TRINITY_DN1937_c0_g1_i1.p1 TRINITY_DN1937_c0_g1~~TRINITY_DN1937_c0_g1_i1.p1  ORF type:complete len:676 (+),score=129.65 TRINITY_DN1937_c0_g1_i1:93-2120(+)
MDKHPWHHPPRANHQRPLPSGVSSYSAMAAKSKSSSSEDAPPSAPAAPSITAAVSSSSAGSSSFFPFRHRSSTDPSTTKDSGGALSSLTSSSSSIGSTSFPAAHTPSSASSSSHLGALNNNALNSPWNAFSTSPFYNFAVVEASRNSPRVRSGSSSAEHVPHHDVYTFRSETDLQQSMRSRYRSHSDNLKNALVIHDDVQMLPNRNSSAESKEDLEFLGVGNRDRLRSHSDNDKVASNATGGSQPSSASISTDHSPYQSDSELDFIVSEKRIRSSSAPMRHRALSPAISLIPAQTWTSSSSNSESKQAGGGGGGKVRTRSRSKGKKEVNTIDETGGTLGVSNASATSFNVYDRKVSPALQQAWDAVFGVPFRGSIAYVGVIEKKPGQVGFSVLQSNHEIRHRFQGCSQADLTVELRSPVKAKFDIVVRSAGYDDGNFAEVLVNGEQCCKNERGINLCIINPVSGAMDVEVFDTFSVNGSDEVARLESFITGKLFEEKKSYRCVRLVCISVKEDCSKNLKDQGKLVLESLGIKFDPRDDYQKLIPLIESGALPPEKTPSLLNLCAKSNAYKTIELLIKNGWRIDYRPKHGLQNTALHDAIFHGSKEAAQALIRGGANFHIRNKIGETAEEMILKAHGQDIDGFVSTNAGEHLANSDTSNDEAVVASVLAVLDLKYE